MRAGSPAEPRIGLALGGGFARGIAHAGVLRVFEQHGIPLHCITGVSAGAIVAAAYASGAEADEIARVGCSMRFRDVAKWSICRMGVMGSERMKRFLEGLLKTYKFEDMRIPLGVVATDLCTGKAVSFRDTGDVFLPIRASCAYPGLFQPVACDDRLLVDGAMSMEIPAVVARELGATHVISVALPAAGVPAAAEGCLPGDPPLLPDHAGAQRGWLAPRERSDHRAGSQVDRVERVRERTGAAEGGRSGGAGGAAGNRVVGDEDGVVSGPGDRAGQLRVAPGFL